MKEIDQLFDFDDPAKIALLRAEYRRMSEKVSRIADEKGSPSDGVKREARQLVFLDTANRLVSLTEQALGKKFRAEEKEYILSRFRAMIGELQ